MTNDNMPNRHLFTQFCGQMYAEMLKHRDEKWAFNAMSPENTHALTIFQVKERIKIIGKTNDVEIIEKQSVHIANYLFLMWCKMLETEKLNK